MIRKSRCVAAVSPLVILLVVLVLANSQAQAQVEKPFKITGEGVGPDGLPFPGQPPRENCIVGNATHLGRHTGLGSVETATVYLGDLPERITGTFGSGTPFVFTGANGDELVCDFGRDAEGGFTGIFELTILGINLDGDLIVEALWIAEFVPLSEVCTGKFKGVTGSWIMFANSEPFVLGSCDPLYYEWEGDGSLTFQKKK